MAMGLSFILSGNMPKITKKAAKKELTGLNLAALKRRMSRLEFRVRVLERLLAKKGSQTDLPE